MIADFGVAAVIVLALVIAGSLIARSLYGKRHPPLTVEERNLQLERELGMTDNETE